MKPKNIIDEIEVSLKIIEPHAWLWIIVCALLLSMIIIWSVFGRLTLTVSSPGILLPEEHFQYAEKLISENKHARQSRLEMLKKILDDKRKLYQKHYLTLIDLEKAEYEYDAARYDLMHGSQLINPYANKKWSYSYNMNPDQNYYALVFIRNIEGKKISPGMDAYILPSNLSEYEYGYIKGKVVNISRYPVTRDQAYSYLGNMSLVDEYFLGGSPFVAKIRLERNIKTKSGFAFTSTKGPPFNIDAGSTLTAKIIHKSAQPIKFLMPD